MRRAPLACLGLAVALGLAASGQAPENVLQSARPQQPPPPAFHVGVDAVRIDAVVTDKHGHVVTDLTADDFELRQDGDPEVLTLAQYVRESAPVTTGSRTTLAASAASPAAPQPQHPLDANRVQRTIALVVDDLGLSWESIRDTRKAMHTFIDDRVQPGDLVGILRTSTFSGALQQFTTDKHRLHDIVDQVRYTAASRRGISPLPSTPKSHGNSIGAAEMDALIAQTNGMPGPAEVDSALVTLSALTTIVHGARDLPGRKVVILLSEGFRLDAGDSGFIDPRIRRKFELLYDEAARAGVVIYTLDVRGLLSGCATAEDAGAGTGGNCQNIPMIITTEDSLWTIAHETGGQAIENTNDLARGLARVDEAEQGYYLLGYTPTASTFAKPGKTVRFHKISLRVKRPDLQVRVRSGFLGHPDSAHEEPKTPAEQMFAAATSPFVTTTIPVQATVLPGFTREDGNYLRTLMHLDVDTFTTAHQEGRDVIEADVLALVFDEWGNQVATRANTLTFAPNARTGSGAGAVVYSIKLPVSHGGGYQVRLAIRDRASGALGSAGRFVEVQDAAHGDFALSGVLLAGEAKVHAASEPGVTPAVVPSDPTRRVFTPGGQLVYTYEIYNPPAVVEVTPSVWHEGTQVFAAPPSSIEPGSKAGTPLKVGGGLQLTGSMAPGDYVLQIAATAKDRRGHPTTVIRHMDFQVQ